MNEIIEKLNIIKNDILKEKAKDLLFFGLLERKDSENKWDIIITADWIMKNNSEEDLIYIIDKLKNSFNENLDFLSRILLLEPKDLFVKNLVRALKSRNATEGEIFDLKLDEGFLIRHMFIISLDLKGYVMGPDVEEPTSKTNKEAMSF